MDSFLQMIFKFLIFASAYLWTKIAFCCLGLNSLFKKLVVVSFDKQGKVSFIYIFILLYGKRRIALMDILSFVKFYNYWSL